MISDEIWQPQFQDKHRTLKFPFACFSCRKSFKRNVPELTAPDSLKCPQCGEPAVRLSRNFKPPPTGKIEQWAKVAALVDAGFRFEHVQGPNGYQPYPEKLSHVADFVRRFPRTKDKT